MIAISPSALKTIQASLEPVRKTKVYAEVAAQIRQLIAGGRLKPGDMLPPERELAEVFGVSRSSVRDAIRVLEAQGLVVPRHGEGTVVRSTSPEQIVHGLAQVLTASKDLTADLFDMRKMLEPPIARAAAFRATDEDVRELAAILERQAHHEGTADQIEDDNAFHYRIAVAAKNRVVLQTMDVLMDLLRESRARWLEVPGRAEKSLEGHRRVLDAIRRRDPERAAARMREHIEEIESVLAPDGGRLEAVPAE